VNASRAPWLRPLVALTVSAVFFVPLYFALVNVFKPGREISVRPAAVPIPPTLDNIERLLGRSDRLFWASLTNSIVVTAVSVVILTVFSAMLGHYLARSRSRWVGAATVVLLAGLMIPPQAILLPIVHVMQALHLMSTLQGLILLNIGYYVPFGVFVFSGFMRQIPRELEGAAAIDGASRFQTFWRVVFPLLRPASASVMIFLTPLVILGPSRGTTITTGIYRAIGYYQADFGQIFALMFLATLPVLIFYLAMRRHFIKGLTGGATKG
jgi:raffinose/stachyose/melibiose transport system permease protein